MAIREVHINDFSDVAKPTIAYPEECDIGQEVYICKHLVKVVRKMTLEEVIANSKDAYEATVKAARPDTVLHWYEVEIIR